MVENLLSAVPLVCIASTHGSCSYSWECINDSSRHYKSVPVLFVVEPGLYQCTVQFEGKKIKSHCISVTVQPSQWFCYIN